MTEFKTTPSPARGSWADQKSKLKKEFPTLTDSDLQFEYGKKDDMLSKVQIKVGKTKEELAAIISAF